MPCRHLRELYAICNTHNLKLSSSDLIRIVCPSCGVTEVCPSLLCEEYDLQHPEEPSDSPKDHPTFPNPPSSAGKNPPN
jgi:hypothetical protein